MPAKQKPITDCKPPGTLEYIGGKWYCIGEKTMKTTQKNRRFRLKFSKTKKHRKTGKNKK